MPKTFKAEPSDAAELLDPDVISASLTSFLRMAGPISPTSLDAVMLSWRHTLPIVSTQLRLDAESCESSQQAHGIADYNVVLAQGAASSVSSQESIDQPPNTPQVDTIDAAEPGIARRGIIARQAQPKRKPKWSLYTLINAPQHLQHKRGLYNCWDTILEAMETTRVGGFVAKGHSTLEDAAQYWQDRGFALPMPDFRN